jgi:stage III sporulation protein AB
MIKLLGVIVVVFSAGFIGIISSERLKSRASELTLTGYLIDEISVLIRYKAMPVYEISAYLKNDKIGSQLDFIRNLDDDGENSFSAAWEKSIDASRLALSASDKALLKTFGSSLGTSDIQGQLSTLELYKESFKKLENDAVKIYEEKSKLFRSMGFLAGAFIAVMLI